MGDERASKTAALIEVNRNILDAARDSISDEADWEFFCECGRSDCHERVTLTLDTYVALQDSGEPVLAVGHLLSPLERERWLRREGRRGAAAAREEARALHAQSAHQERRARKNLAAARLNVRGRVLVVDDNGPFRQAAKSIISNAAQLRLVGFAASGEEALQLLPDLEPDLILLDIRLPGIDGVETARIIRRGHPNTLIALISAEPAGWEVEAASVGAALLNKKDLRPHTLDTLWLQHLPRDWA